MSKSNLIHKQESADFGRLDNEYVSDGLTVRIYSPDCSEQERTKADIHIRERITDIVSEVDYSKVSNF